MRHKSTELMGTIKAFVEEYYKNYRHGLSTLFQTNFFRLFSRYCTGV